MEFMKKVEKISKKIGETASGTYNVVVDKSGKVIEDTKSKFAISEKEEKIYEIYIEMGKTVYEMYQKGEDVGEVFGEQSKKIDELNKEIDEINKKILTNKGLKECTECGKEIPIDSHFCKHCGNEQINIEIVEEPIETEKVCNKCGNVCDDNAKFCPNCGSDLSK